MAIATPNTSKVGKYQDSDDSTAFYHDEYDKRLQVKPKPNMNSSLQIYIAE